MAGLGKLMTDGTLCTCAISILGLGCEWDDEAFCGFVFTVVMKSADDNHDHELDLEDHLKPLFFFPGQTGVS